jgi:3'(2'), 5'-bisphosphate nucleotidase
MSFERELAVALEAADAAGRLILEYYERFVPIPDAPSSISTDADRDSQELVLQTIRHHFPNDALCAEEKTPTLESAIRNGPRLWIVDPIDGTAGFARKNGEFSVMIAFVENGAMMVGIVLKPVDWVCTFARKGDGCWRYRGAGGERVRCHVGNATELATAKFTQSRSKTAKASPLVAKLKPAKTLETYSAGLKLAQVASGEADVYANTYPEFHDWDICAGHILVEEAGGKVTTLSGAPVEYGTDGFKQRGGLLATNGILHERVMGLLK